MVERTPLEMTRLTTGPHHLIRTWGPRHIAYLPSGEIVLTCMGATSGRPVPNLDAGINTGSTTLEGEEMRRRMRAARRTVVSRPH